MADNTDTQSADPTAQGATDHQAEIRTAIAEIRREGRKAAFIHAIVDAVAAVMILNLALSMLGPAVLDRTVGPPITVNRLIAIHLGTQGVIPPVRYGTLLAIATGPFVFIAEFLWLLRRPLVERFEAANPSVQEALRTARDTVQRDADGPIARALYADVIDRLQTTSSIGLLNVARIMIALGLILGAGLAAVQVSVVGFEVELATTDESDGAGPTVETTHTPDPDELQSGESVLGEPTDVTAGSENLSAEVAASAGGRGTEQRPYGSGGTTDSDSAVDSQRAGYARPEEVEDAELIREYARRIASQQEETNNE
ncbi:MAG: hypothetical protein SVG88_03860 [Halobacteriales archaeon]|nr:hypothetical protein [Halobacteriales archaeon]